jgi:hypothetical protein
VGRVRWERLFDDLEARFDAEQHAAVEADLADLIRAERSQVVLLDRLRAHLGEPLMCSFGSEVAMLSGDLAELGADWVLIDSGWTQTLVPVAALQYVSGLSAAVVPDRSIVARKLGLNSVLRGLARDRALLGIRLRAGELLTGTLDRVGADHMDVAVHPHDVPRRNRSVSGVRTLLTQAVVSVSVRG